METGADGRCAEPRKPSYCPGGKVHRGPLLARPAGSPGSPATCTIRRRGPPAGLSGRKPRFPSYMYDPPAQAPCRLVRQEAQVLQLHVPSTGARPPAGLSGRKPRLSSYMYHPPARAPCRLVRQEAQALQLHVPSTGARPPAGSSGRKPRFSPATCTIRRARPPAGLSGRKPRFPSYMYDPPAHGPLPACPAGSPGSPATCTIRRRTAPCRLVRQEAQVLQLHVRSAARAPCRLVRQEAQVLQLHVRSATRGPFRLVRQEAQVLQLRAPSAAHGPLPACPAGSPG